MPLTKRLCSVVGAVILSSFLTKPCFAQDKTKIDFYGHVGWFGNWDANPCQIPTIPLQVRNVPIHPDDTYVPKTNAGPIKDSQIDCPSILTSFQGRLGVGLRNKVADLGAAFVIGSTLHPGIIGGEKPELRNYTNDVGSSTRGYGAALTYYDKNLIHRGYDLGFALKASRKIGSKGDYSYRGFIEYQALWDSVSISNGWDRYDELEEMSKYKLYDVINSKITTGIEILVDDIAGFRVALNFNRNKVNPTQLGSQSDYRFRNSVGLELGYMITSF